MKRKSLIRRTGLLTALLLFFVICQGCSEPTEKENEQDSFFDALGEGPDVPNLTIVFSETEHNPLLAAFLTEYYQIPDERLAETRYYYNYVDLNEDGKDEIAAAVIGEYTMKDGGDCVLLLEENGSDFHVIGSFAGVRTPVIISDAVENGWREIIFPVCSSVLETGYITCRYNTNVEQTGYLEQEELFSDTLPAAVTGTQILSNNLIDDMDKGIYLTLDE